MSDMLKEIKDIYNVQNERGNLIIELNTSSFKWLIDQAKKVEQLEKVVQEYKENDEYIYCPNCGMIKND